MTVYCFFNISNYKSDWGCQFDENLNTVAIIQSIPSTYLSHVLFEMHFNTQYTPHARRSVGKETIALRAPFVIYQGKRKTPPKDKTTTLDCVKVQLTIIGLSKLKSPTWCSI